MDGKELLNNNMDNERKMIQIQFLDGNIINALVPVFSLKPDIVFFLFDKEDISKKQRGNFEKALKRKYPEIEQNYLEVDKYAFLSVIKTIEKIITDNSENDFYFDITGGTEIMTACGLMACHKYSCKATYMRLSRGEIFDILTGQVVCKTENLSLSDYLEAIGAKKLDNSHHVPEEEDFERLTETAEWIFDYEKTWHAFSHYIDLKIGEYKIENHKEKLDEDVIEKLSFSIPQTLRYNDRTYKTEDITNLFVRKKFLAKNGKKYRFTDMASLEYLSTYGVWLEIYIYIKAKEFFDESYIGYVIDWDNADMEDTRDNEFDVIALKNSVPYFISCKMRKPEPKDAYEVAYLAKRLGGKEAKGIIATTYDISGEEAASRNINNRFKKMHIHWITPEKFKGKSSYKVFKSVL